MYHLFSLSSCPAAHSSTVYTYLALQVWQIFCSKASQARADLLALRRGDTVQEDQLLSALDCCLLSTSSLPRCQKSMCSRQNSACAAPARLQPAHQTRTLNCTPDIPCTIVANQTLLQANCLQQLVQRGLHARLAAAHTCV